MFQSGGVLKSDTVLWTGSLKNLPSNLQIGSQWSSYAELYRKQLWVNVVIDKRAKAAARLPFKVYQHTNDGRVGAGDSAFGQLMAKPSKSIDPFLFWMWTVSTKDIHGEAFWLKVRDTLGRPVELVPIHPTKVLSETDDAGRTKWSLRMARADISVDRRDLVHFREFNPDTIVRGMSKLEPLRSTLENEDGSRRANSAMWRNGGKPSFALSHPGQLSEPAVKRLAAQWADVHGGVDNWGKTVVLEEGMTATMYQLNVEELQYIEARKLNREEVCGAYDIPPPVVHILDRATFSNITEQMRSMYRDTMGTVLGALESTVETELRDGTYGANTEPDFGSSFYGEFLLDEVLRGDFEARQAAYAMADYMTIAEKRSKENLPFIEGTDYIFMNSASLPLGANGSLVMPGVPEASPLRSRPASNAAIPAFATETAPTQLRSIMGRIGRAKSLAQIDPVGLVAGMGDEAVTVLEQLLTSQLAAESVDDFKSRVRALTADTPRRIASEEDT